MIINLGKDGKYRILNIIVIGGGKGKLVLYKIIQNIQIN